jgi:integral membrane protein
MPLKYLAHMPAATRIAGSVHGLLFLAFVVSLFKVATERRWPLSRSLGALTAAILPFGAFVLERALRREANTEDGGAR